MRTPEEDFAGRDLWPGDSVCQVLTTEGKKGLATEGAGREGQTDLQEWTEQGRTAAGARLFCPGELRSRRASVIVAQHGNVKQE